MHETPAQEQHAPQLVELEARCRRRTTLAPASAPAFQSLAALCEQTGREEEAESLLRQAADCAPQSAGPKTALAGLLGKQGRHEEAAHVLREAVRLAPGNALAHNNLGVALENTGKPAEAVEAYRRAIALRPAYAEAHNHLGNALRMLGRFGEAESAHREAIRLRPGYAPAYSNLAATLAGLGRAEEVVAAYRKLVELRPGSAVAGSDLLLALHYLDAIGPREMFEEHVKWVRLHAEPISAKAVRHAPPAPSAEGALRVGYISTYLREHPVARFFEPLLANHGRAGVEVVCYADAERSDAVTARLRSYGHPWRDIAGLSDEQAAQLITRDRIDILVDLGGHMGNPRLPLFARKLAPVQVSYLGYPDTTGLRTVDYRMTDGWHDPPGLTEAYHTDQLVRLPRCCWSYSPGEDLPAVGTLPAASTGGIAFGVMNRLVKVTPRMMELWSRILASVPNSRLMVLVARGVEREPLVRERFAAAGIDAGRLLLVPQRPRREYLELFNSVDLALDTFPYAGHTTTCDALWMGVPTVSLAGTTHVSRTGASLLTAVGLPGLVAQTPDEYVGTATALAGDLTRLAGLRGGLRERVARSALADGPGLAAVVEAAFREMWHKRQHAQSSAFSA